MMQQLNHIQASYCPAKKNIKLQELNNSLAYQRLVAVTETVQTLQQYFYWCRFFYNAFQNNAFIQQAEIMRHTSAALYMAITDKHTGQYLGEIGYDWKAPDNSSVNVFYWIRKTAQQKGYASLALPLFIQYLKINATAQYAEMKIIPGNTASKQLVLRAGAAYSHTLTGIVMPTGLYGDIECYHIRIV